MDTSYVKSLVMQKREWHCPSGFLSIHYISAIVLPHCLTLGLSLQQLVKWYFSFDKRYSLFDHFLKCQLHVQSLLTYSATSPFLKLYFHFCQLKSNDFLAPRVSVGTKCMVKIYKNQQFSPREHCFDRKADWIAPRTQSSLHLDFLKKSSFAEIPKKFSKFNILGRCI